MRLMEQSLTFDVREASKVLQHPLLRSWSSRDEGCSMTYTVPSLYVPLLCNSGGHRAACLGFLCNLQREEKNNPKASSQECRVGPFLHLRVTGPFSHAAAGAELCRWLKRLCAAIVSDEYLRCASQWNAERKDSEKDRGTTRSQVGTFCS